jgi:thiol:disulfide interchange protein DsbC
MINRLSIIITLLFYLMPSFAQDSSSSEVSKTITALYPKTYFREILATEIPGIYEVVMGNNIAYTDKNGRYFIFGHLFDMKSQTDITAQRKIETRKVKFPTTLLGNAIKTVRGNGSRVLAVFSDPECGHCKKLESELAKLNDVTIYTFLFPLEQMHPESKTRAITIWCASDQSKAWSDYMLTGVLPELKACDNPINDNLVLGTRIGVVGTPTLISIDGRVHPGTASSDIIEDWMIVDIAQKDKETN